MNRTLHGEGEETKDPMARMAEREKILECPFRECGRKFYSDDELKNHMTRRHKPTAPIEATPSVVETPTKASTVNTPTPSRVKVESFEKKTEPATVIEAGLKHEAVAAAAASHGFAGAKPKIVS